MTVDNQQRKPVLERNYRQPILAVSVVLHNTKLKLFIRKEGFDEFNCYYNK